MIGESALAAKIGLDTMGGAHWPALFAQYAEHRDHVQMSGLLG
jgi:hypothetical protein